MHLVVYYFVVCHQLMYFLVLASIYYLRICVAQGDGATGMKSFAEKHIVRLQKELKENEAEKASKANWSLEDYYKSMPGLREQLIGELEDSQWAVDAEVAKVAALNPNDLIKSLNEGVYPSFPEEINHIKHKIGETDYTAQRAALDKDFENLEKVFTK